MDRTSKETSKQLDLANYLERQRLVMLSLITLLGVGGINKISKLKYLSIGDLELVESRSSGSDER